MSMLYMNYQWSDPFIILLRFCQTLQTINNDIIFNIAGTKIKCNAPILFFIFLVPNYCKWLICLELCSVWNILWNILSTVCQYAFYLFLLWEENILLSVSRFIKYCEQYGWFSVICSVLNKIILYKCGFSLASFGCIIFFKATSCRNNFFSLFSEVFLTSWFSSLTSVTGPPWSLHFFQQSINTIIYTLLFFQFFWNFFSPLLSLLFCLHHFHWLQVFDNADRFPQNYGFWLHWWKHQIISNSFSFEILVAVWCW